MLVTVHGMSIAASAAQPRKRSSHKESHSCATFMSLRVAYASGKSIITGTAPDTVADTMFEQPANAFEATAFTPAAITTEVTELQP